MTRTPRNQESPAKRKRRWFLKQRGVEFTMPVTPVAEHLRKLHGAGMTLLQIAQQSGVSQSTVHAYVQGYRREGGVEVPVETVHASKGRALLAVQFEPAQPCQGADANRFGARVDPTGTMRRIEALSVIGFPTTFLAVLLGTHDGAVHRMLGRKFVFKSTAERIAEVYEKLKFTDPLDFGIEPWKVKRVKTHAVAKGYAPPQCWDDDTIDDPAAIPEWTGACGTPEGYRIHIRETAFKGRRLPPCMPCRESVETRKYVPDCFTFRADRFGELLEGRSVKALSVQLGMPHDGPLHRWRQGTYAPKFRSEVENLAEALRVDISELLIEDQRERPKFQPPTAPGQFNHHAVRVALDIARLSQSKAADLCGVSHAAMSNWLCGRTKPAHKERLQGLADAMGIRVETFFGYE